MIGKRASTAARGGRAALVLAAGLVLAASVVGCTSSGSGPDAAATEDTGAPPATTWTHDAPVAHTPLTATAESFVYGGVDLAALYVVALDPETGAERWRHPASVGSQAPSAGFSIDTDDRAAYFVADTDGAQSMIVAVRSVDGAERWRQTVPGIAAPGLRDCGGALCVRSRVGGRTDTLRLDREDGHLLGSQSNPDGSATVVGRSADGTRMLVVGGDPLTVSEQSVDGVLSWTTPVAALFGPIDAGPSGGYAAIEGPGGTWTLWMGSMPNASIPVGGMLSAGAVVGIGAAGTQTWIRPGRHLCRLFLSNSSAAAPVDCDGQLRRLSMINGAPIVLQVTEIEGFDPVTGRTSWSVDIGPGVNQGEPANLAVRVDDHTYLFVDPRDSVRTTIDLTSGATSPAPPDFVGWCRSAPAQDRVVGPAGSDSFVRPAELGPCHPDGSEAVPSSVPDFVGVRTSGRVAWSTDGVVHAMATG